MSEGIEKIQLPSIKDAYKKIREGTYKPRRLSEEDKMFQKKIEKEIVDRLKKLSEKLGIEEVAKYNGREEAIKIFKEMGLEIPHDFEE